MAQNQIGEIITLKTNINEEPIKAAYAYEFFTELENAAVREEQSLVDLQVGGMAPEDYTPTQLLNSGTMP